MEREPSAGALSPDFDMSEERRLELLHRVLRFDIEDAILRYQVEAGHSVASLSVTGADGGEFEFRIEVNDRVPVRRPVPPPPVFVVNLRK